MKWGKAAFSHYFHCANEDAIFVLDREDVG
jgi:hypothetical protein